MKVDGGPSPHDIMGLAKEGGTTVMSKHRTKSSPREALLASGRPASTSRSTLREAFLGAVVCLREVMVNFGLKAFTDMLEDDRTELCGPKNRPQAERAAYRHGYDEGRVVLGGRKVVLEKPRVRSVEGAELELPSWKRAQEEDPLQERVLEQVLVGVSSRKYGRSLEELTQDVPSVSTSRSSFSRQLIARTTQQVGAFLSRPLGELDLPVVMLDGTPFGDHVLVTALGIDVTGRKHVLGVVEGTTESEEVCLNLLRSLIERGLPVERGRLFVIDGGKGLRKAIRTVFGSWALVQRCHIHKMRNVVEHLPERKKAWVRAALRRAWGQDTVSKARGKLLDLAEQLEQEHPSAAASIREGLDETLTITSLGVAGWLWKTLHSTNPIENLQGSLQRVARNVKRWRGGSMALRWAVAALIEAEKHFRRVKGHRELPQLIAALAAHAPASSVKTVRQIA